MGKAAVPQNIVESMIALRQSGHSLPEIKDITGRGYGTVYKYIKDIEILPEYQERWKLRRRGSVFRSLGQWEHAKIDAKKAIQGLDSRDKLLILACLYWGEGTKRELNIINSDPELLRVFLCCLRELKMQPRDLRITLRLYADIDREEAIRFWSRTLGVSKKQIIGVNVLEGRKKGRLPYGMCRLRLRKGGEYFKLIMSMIGLIKSEVK